VQVQGVVAARREVPDALLQVEALSQQHRRLQACVSAASGGGASASSPCCAGANAPQQVHRPGHTL
jgi:hypothetical protein